MAYQQKLRAFYVLLAVAALTTYLAADVGADPLPGQVLKFSQKPLDGLAVPDANGTVKKYYGHDELSTAYGQQNAVGEIPVYRGRFMADDFADRFDSPVVHIKWWGSYLNNLINPKYPVDKFLITFESDVPADASDPTSFSTPGVPLSSQIVRRVPAGPLAAGSGTFTEKLVSAGGLPLNEELYQYNAELNLGKEFPQQRDEVYWLKIVALVDVDQLTFDPLNPLTDITQWGWHSRDYSVNNPLASTAPAVVPGERVVGTLPGTNIDIWHFQDDAVTGIVNIDTTTNPNGQIMPDVNQDLFEPTHYLDGIDGPGSLVAGVPGIGRFSKDLAFELYTIPEPTTCLLMLIGLGSVMARRR